MRNDSDIITTCLAIQHDTLDNMSSQGAEADDKDQEASDIDQCHQTHAIQITKYEAKKRNAKKKRRDTTRDLKV